MTARELIAEVLAKRQEHPDQRWFSYETVERLARALEWAINSLTEMHTKAADEALAAIEAECE